MMTSIEYDKVEKELLSSWQRERIAIAAMQGLVASGESRILSAEEIAETSVEIADALIQELKKEKNNA